MSNQLWISILQVLLCFLAWDAALGSHSDSHGRQGFFSKEEGIGTVALVFVTGSIYGKCNLSFPRSKNSIPFASPVSLHSIVHKPFVFCFSTTYLLPSFSRITPTTYSLTTSPSLAQTQCCLCASGIPNPFLDDASYITFWPLVLPSYYSSQPLLSAEVLSWSLLTRPEERHWGPGCHLQPPPRAQSMVLRTPMANSAILILDDLFLKS